jgi:hypothetical protein
MGDTKIVIKLDRILTELAFERIHRFHTGIVDVETETLVFESQKKLRTAIRRLKKSKVLDIKGSLSYLGDPYRGLLSKLESSVKEK